MCAHLNTDLDGLRRTGKSGPLRSGRLGHLHACTVLVESEYSKSYLYIGTRHHKCRSPQFSSALRTVHIELKHTSLYSEYEDDSLSSMPEPAVVHNVWSVV